MLVKDKKKKKVIVDVESYRKIKYRMVDLDISERELSKIIGVSNATINQVIRGFSQNDIVREKLEEILEIKVW